MTPDELDAIEATISESTAWDGYGLDRAQVSDLIAALREAWKERDESGDAGWQNGYTAALRDTVAIRKSAEKAEAEVERLRACFHHDGDWVDALRLYDERNEARSALDRLRAVIAPRTAHDCPSCGVLAREVEAAIEGQP